MSRIDLKLMQNIVPGTDSQAGLGFLEYYGGHRVYHPGVDLNKGFGNQDKGLPCFTPCAGVVQFVSKRRSNGGFGLHVVIRHEELGVWSHWLHLDKALVEEGQEVKPGHGVGLVGNTGTKWAHLHFEVWKRAMYDKQRKHWRKYSFYPSRWPKWKVAQYYMDPVEFVKESLKLVEKDPDPVINNVKIGLSRDSENGKIYIEQDGMYIHIADEDTFNAIFGDFSNADWNDGPAIKPKKVKGTLQLILK